MLKKLIAHSLVFSLIFNNLAFATQSIIELDFKDSQTPQRLHVIPRMSNVGDVSHLEIDTEQKQAAVYLKEKQEDHLDELQKHSSQGGDVPVTTKPVILQKHDIINLPWNLGAEILKSFLLQHTAWLTPLGEDGYKLEFKGCLLGGGNTGSTGGGGGNSGNDRDGGSNSVTVKAYCPSNPNWSSSNNEPCGQPTSKTNDSYTFGPSQYGGNDKKGDYGNSTSSSTGSQICKTFTGNSLGTLTSGTEKQLRKNLSSKAYDIMKYQGLFKGAGDIFAHDFDPMIELAIEEMAALKFESMFSPHYLCTRDADYRANKIRTAFKKQADFSDMYKYQKDMAAPRVVRDLPLVLIRMGMDTLKSSKETVREGFILQEKPFSSVTWDKKPSKILDRETIYHGFNYNLGFDLTPQHAQQCRGKMVGLCGNLKTYTPNTFRMQIAVFNQGKFKTGSLSDFVPGDGQYHHMIAQLHFNFNEYDQVTVRPVMANKSPNLNLYKEGELGAINFSFWIGDGTLLSRTRSFPYWGQNKNGDLSVYHALTGLTYPVHLEDRKKSDAFLPSKNHALDTGNRLFQEFLADMASEENSSSLQNVLAVAPYIKNNVLQHAPLKDKGFPDLKTRSQSLLAMAAEALYGDSTQDFLDKSKIFYTKAIPFQELSKAYQTHHEILGHMLPLSWQEMIKNQGKTALTPHSDSLAKWSILHDVATEMGRRCGIPVPSVFSTLDVIQSITNAGFEFFALEPEDRKVFCQQFDGFGKSLCEWLDYNFDPLFDGVLLLTTKGQGKGVPIKGLQLKPKFQLKPNPQQIKEANNVLQKVRLRTKLELEQAGLIDNKGQLTKKAIDDKNLTVVTKGEKIQNVKVIEELTKDGSKIEDWSKVATNDTITLRNGKKGQIHFYKHNSGKVNTNIDFKFSEPVPIDKGYEVLNLKDLLK